MLKILFFGDIVGRPGREAVKKFIEENREKLGADLIVGNADNVASGRGPTLKTYEEMLDAGIDVLTCGDHIWDQKEAIEILEQNNSKMIRPYNYPKTAPGKGFISLNIKGQDILIAAFLGRVFTTEGLDNPFTEAEEFLKTRKEKIIIIDFHAEATSEKIAFARNLSGKATAVLGTHTHVQTSDEKILKNHTATITDVGFCGPSESVIGVDEVNSIKRFKTGMPLKFEVAAGPTQVNAVLVEVDEKTGAATKIVRIQEVYE